MASPKKAQKKKPNPPTARTQFSTIKSGTDKLTKDGKGNIIISAPLPQKPTKARSTKSGRKSPRKK